MKRRIFLIVFVALLILPAITMIAPVPTSLPGANVYDITRETMKDFEISEDYPYGDQVTDPINASAGSALPVPNGDYTDTWTVGDSDYHVTDTGSPYSCTLELNFSTTSIGENFAGEVFVSLYAKHMAVTGPTTNEIDIYDADTSSWETVGSMTYDAWTWVNVTVDGSYAVDDKILVRFYMDNAISSASAYVDYAEIVITYGDFSGPQLADGYDYGNSGIGASGDHESTWVNLDADELREDYAANNEGWWILNFTIPPSPTGAWTGFNYSTYARSFEDWGEDPQIQFWDFVGDQWVKFDDYENDWAWHNGSASSNYIGGTNVTMRGWIEAQGTYAGLLYCDYAELVFFDEAEWHEFPPAQMWFDINGWSLIFPVGFIFPIPWSAEMQFGYDAFFIFLGLIMIPASTMYLVRGGRKGMSTDKFFYGIVVFALGIGFLIGGIMP